MCTGILAFFGFILEISEFQKLCLIYKIFENEISALCNLIFINFGISNVVFVVFELHIICEVIFCCFLV
jgi:hypothetical protein